MKQCAKCGQTFDQKKTGRLRIGKKVRKGEQIAWICPSCAREVLK